MTRGGRGVARAGAWLAYESDESGRHEIYARAVSGTGGKWEIPAGGGDHPRWSRDGRQIVYRSGKRMMAASVAIGAALTVERPRVLFEGEFEGADAGRRTTTWHPTAGS